MRSLLALLGATLTTVAAAQTTRHPHPTHAPSTGQHAGTTGRTAGGVMGFPGAATGGAMGQPHLQHPGTTHAGAGSLRTGHPGGTTGHPTQQHHQHHAGATGTGSFYPGAGSGFGAGTGPSQAQMSQLMQFLAQRGAGATGSQPLMSQLPAVGGMGVMQPDADDRSSGLGLSTAQTAGLADYLARRRGATPSGTAPMASGLSRPFTDPDDSGSASVRGPLGTQGGSGVMSGSGSGVTRVSPVQVPAVRVTIPTSSGGPPQQVPPMPPPLPFPSGSPGM